MFKKLVCLAVGTLAVGSQAFMPSLPMVKISSSAAARVYQPAQSETGTCEIFISAGPLPWVVKLIISRSGSRHCVW